MTGQAGSGSTDYVEKMEHGRYGRSVRSRRSTFKIVFLSVALALVSLVLVVVAIYSTVKISSLNVQNSDLKFQLSEKEEALSQLGPELDKVKNDLEILVQEKFPNLYELKVNKVLSINDKYIKNVVFNIIKHSNQLQYKYLLVVENDSPTKIKPSFRVLLFDQYGVHIATDEVHDSDDLNPGESRDYASQIEFFFDTQPRHFYINDITKNSSK